MSSKPEEQWLWYLIDPDTCIDCGACVPECPYEAILPEDEVPEAYTAKAGQVLNLHEDIQPNLDFFKEGPGYEARKMP